MIHKKIKLLRKGPILDTVVGEDLHEKVPESITNTVHILANIITMIHEKIKLLGKGSILDMVVREGLREKAPGEQAPV